MKAYPIKFEIYDDAEGLFGTVTGFDGDCMSLKVDNKLIHLDDVDKLANVIKQCFYLYGKAITPNDFTDKEVKKDD